MAVSDAATTRLRTVIGLSASAAFLGIALSVIGLEATGGILTVGALASLAGSLHRFGRTGPDAALLLPGDDGEET